MIPLRLNFNPRAFIPRYDELSLYLMSLSFLLTFLANGRLRTMVFTAFADNFDPRYFPLYIVLFLFLAGLAFSIYHVFSSRKKTPEEKEAMLYFAVIINGLAGILAGARMFEDSPGILLLFPVWNILNSLVLLGMYWLRMVNEETISDDNTPLVDVLAGSVAVLALYGLCRWLDLYWAYTFSICVAYATSLSSAFHRLLLGRRRKRPRSSAH